MPPDISTHPCFNIDARHRHGRVHLPIAPDCNVQCNFCKRIYDCANESRPGVTTAILSPQQSLDYLRACWPRTTAFRSSASPARAIPFATPSLTLETLRLVREAHPEMLLCVASNGLGVPPHAEHWASWP